MHFSSFPVYSANFITTFLKPVSSLQLKELIACVEDCTGKILETDLSTAWGQEGGNLQFCF